MKKCLAVLLFCFACFPPASGSAADWETYSQSVVNAKAHADAPTAAWVAATADMVKVAEAGSVGANPQGLQFYGNPANNQLIVRTLSSSSVYNGVRGSATAGTNYSIFGAKNELRAWVTTGQGMTSYIDTRGLTAGTVIQGLERGLGMDTTGTHDAIFEMAVTVGNAGDNLSLLRPTRNPDPTTYSTTPADHGTNAAFPADAAAAGIGAGAAADAVFANYKAAYAAWANQAYSTYPFPWTQLGYTYVWGQAANVPANLSDVQGMAEFILLGGTGSSDPAKTPSGTNEAGRVVVVGIYAPQSYLYTKNDGTALSDAAGAQYGNGFASFAVTGPCDTLWAGAAFQVGTNLNAASPNTITVGAGGAVSGGQGILVGSRNYTVTNAGFITANADAKKFNLSGSENIALLFKGDPHAGYVGAVKNILANAGTITAPGGAGTAVAAWAGDTQITNNAGGVISGGAYAIRTGAGDDAVTVNGGEIAGRIDLGTGTDTLAVTGAGNARFNFTLTRDSAASAQVANAETVTIADDSTTLAVRMAAGTPNVRNGDSFLIVDAASALTVDPARLAIVSDSLPMVSFAAQKTGNRLSLVAARDGLYYGGRSGNASLGTVLDGLADSAAGDMATVIGALDASGDPGNARRLAPVVNGGSVQAGFQTAGQVSRAIVSRIDRVLASRDTGGGLTGIAAGDEAAGEGIWGQGFGSFLRQDPRDGGTGYEANLWGGAFGYDRFVFPSLLAGFGGGYSHTAIRTNDAGTWTNVEGYQANLYGSLARDAWYLDALASYAYNRYDAERHLAFGGLDRTAKADYAGQQLSGYLEGGYGFQPGRIVITPLASLQVVRLRLDGYTERGAGDANLSVAGQNYHLVQTGLGAKLAWPIRERGVRITPELHAKWLHDFAGDRQQTTSQFTGGGASFTTEGFAPARSSLNAGAKLTVMTKANLTLSLGYDFESKADFTGHTGSLQVRYAF
jgi:outer membrane autotransporter protein